MGRHSELPALLKRYGGLGSNAELLSQVRGTVAAGGTAATLALLQKFADTQREYVKVMAVLSANS